MGEEVKVKEQTVGTEEKKLGCFLGSQGVAVDIGLPSGLRPQQTK